MVCLSQRDDADRILRAFCERYNRNVALNRPNSNPSFFPIVFTRVGTNKKSASEHLFRLGEMESVLSEGWSGF